MLMTECELYMLAELFDIIFTSFVGKEVVNICGYVHLACLAVLIIQE